ncbi:MAG: hypothetical protein HOI66_18990 [Verrucomicrobia bacterium]|jgi:hypothetical protein|nr:hypothetical protein [Verrucomicrobiota bacterium]
MKATFNVPDDLYREVKARSALEGRPVREVVITLFQQWLGQNRVTPRKETNWSQFEAPLQHLKKSEITDHSMEAIRASIKKRFDETV